jgi:GH43 family beta-xylosidase
MERFICNYSSTFEESDDPHDQRMKVATSNRPEGPYEYQKSLYETFSIDAHVVRGEDGHHYLYYSNNEYVGIDSNRPGTVILMDRLLDMYTPEGNPTLVVEPTLDEEIFQENRFRDGRDWHTIEGAFYFKRRGKHYCMFSGNAYTRPTYFIGYSIADQDAISDSLTNLKWNKYPDNFTYSPLMKKNNDIEGVGHNSVAKAPNGIDELDCLSWERKNNS